jgi:hypothetical protein
MDILKYTLAPTENINDRPCQGARTLTFSLPIDTEN